MEIPKTVIYAILAMVTIAIVILVMLFLTTKAGGENTFLTNYTNWSGKWVVK